MLEISLSFSGKKHEGARLPRQEEADGLIDYDSEDYIHDQKKRNKDPKRNTAIPYEDSEDGENYQVHVKKEIWLGRRERDPAEKRSRMDRLKGSKFNGGFTR